MLLIDDDQNVREVLAQLLASFGYECQTAGDGVSGLGLFDQGAGIWSSSTSPCPQ